VGGGHSLHVICDLTLASAEHATFKQTDPDVASFDGGFGSALLARQVGQKKAREIFFLGKNYSAEEAVEMGMANEAVPHEELEDTALDWAETINGKSPTAIRMLKYAFNAVDDGMVGQQVFAGDATRLAYMTDEAQEGRDAFLEGRDPDWRDVPWHYCWERGSGGVGDIPFMVRVLCSHDQAFRIASRAGPGDILETSTQAAFASSPWPLR
jgi:naphthoate synthase